MVYFYRHADDADDNIGNPTNDGTWEYSWTQGRRLEEITDGSTTVSYKYNASGIRTEKTVGGTTTKYNIVGSKITWQKTGTSDPIYFLYDSGGKLWGLEYDGNTYFYVRNTQGDIIKIVNSSGTVVVEYAYDAWGNPMSTTGTLASTLGQDNPFRYRGYYFDDETGLYYLNQRYYNPEWGRFINPDDVRGKTGGLLTHNAYAYCASNPVMRADEGGRFFFTCLGAVVGGIIGGVSAAINGEDWVAGAAGGAVAGAMMGALTDITVATCGAAAPLIAIGVGACAGAAGSITTQTVAGVRQGKSFSQAIGDIDRVDVLISAACGAVTGYVSNAASSAVKKLVFDPVKNSAVNAAKKYAYNRASDWSYGAIRSAALKQTLYEYGANTAITIGQNYGYRKLSNRYRRR